MVDLLQSLGLFINHQKSSLEPSPRKQYIDCSLETLEWSGCVTLPNSPLNNNGCICPGLGGLLYRLHDNAQGLWSSRSSFKSSNYRDILAILLGLISFCPRVQGQAVQVLTDNVSAAALIFKLSRWSKQGTVRLGDLHLDFRLGEQYINFCKTPRREAEYSSPPSLSSQHTVYDEKLHPALFQYLDRVWSPHSVNRFASMSSTHLPVYNSWFCHPGTSPVDALAKTDWCMENNDANPPFRVISQVLDIVKAQHSSVTLIAPRWPAQPWFQRLLRLCVCPPIHLRNSRRACLQLHSQRRGRIATAPSLRRS